jgi:DNA-binding MarR family transcriptional regulator/GNAT superfamily N-acetyltransferase
VADAAVRQMRSFNRLVTQRVGALNDGYLARDRPLGEARLLGEIGVEGSEVRVLRARLGLDSGYLSRLLRSLEAARLISVAASDEDRRIRIATLTPAGRAERDLLDRRSDDLARSLLEPLSEGGRERLVTAMAEVERLLTGALVEINPVDPAHRDTQFCLHEYFVELDRRFDGGFDPTVTNSPPLEPLRPPAGVFLVAMLNGEPVGCGGLRFRGEGAAELKRMWVAESARGLGIGRRLLGALERHAAAGGARVVRLDTNKALVEAIGLYRSAGYREVEPFNDEPYVHHWFEKDVTR